jgi:hypothetical protein
MRGYEEVRGAGSERCRKGRERKGKKVRVGEWESGGVRE